MKEYTTIDRPTGADFPQRMRIEGDGDEKAIAIIEMKTTLRNEAKEGPTWVEIARFDISRVSASAIGHASGLIGYA